MMMVELDLEASSTQSTESKAEVSSPHSTEGKEVYVDPGERVVAEAAERRRYTDLELARSAYDNHLLAFLRSDTGRARWRPCWLLIANFIAQFVVVYLLWQKIYDTELVADSELFLSSPGSQSHSLCFFRKDTHWPNPAMEWDVSCSPDEVMLFDFDNLDLDGDGRWNYTEALELDKTYEKQTWRKVNMAQVYRNVFQQIKQHGHGLVLPCTTNDNVEAYTDKENSWTEASIETISSNNLVHVVSKKNGRVWSTHRNWLRKKVGDDFYSCSVPKCVDMDAGATSASFLTCKDYATYDIDCHHPNVSQISDDDFNFMQVCCICGGGSTSLALTGIKHLPMNISQHSVTQSPHYTHCLQDAETVSDQEVCFQNFTFLPRTLYLAELAPLLPFCLVPEPDLCGNFKEQKMLEPVKGMIGSVNTSIPMILKMAGFRTLAELDLEEICRRTVEKICPKIFTIQSSLFKEQREGVCGEKTSQVKDDTKVVEYKASKSYQDRSAFGLMSFKFRMFLLLISFLWGLAAVEEFRCILVWWNTLLTIPTLAGGEPCFKEVGSELEVLGVHRRSRLAVILFNLMPRSVLQCLIFVVGIKYLLSVRSVSDLILNSLALTFLVTIDEMIFEACASASDAEFVRRLRPLQGKTWTRLDKVIHCSRFSVGLCIVVPIILTIGVLVLLDTWETYFRGRSIQCLCDLSGEDCMGSALLQKIRESYV